MSNEFLENPVFATQFISQFSHYEEIDSILLESLDFQQKEEINVALLPIVSHIPEKQRGIMRVFITNTGNTSMILSVYYSITGWFSDLHKLGKLHLVETITINPSQVWFRDIAFRSYLKQGKNYFQVLIGKGKNTLVKRNGKIKRKTTPNDFVTVHCEYSQIREISENEQIERSNFLGMSSRAYVNPRALNYWIYYSLFGSKVYRRENIVLLILKILGIAIGGTLIALYFLLSDIFQTDYMIPVSVIIILISLIGFFSNVDKRKIKLIEKLDLSSNDKKMSLKNIKTTSGKTLEKYGTVDINYSYDKENNVIRWKEGANQIFVKMIPSIARLLHIPSDIKPTLKIGESKVGEIKDKETLKQKIEEGIQLQHEKGIRFKEEIDTVSADSKAMEMEIDSIDVKPTLKSEIDPIETKTDIKQQIDPIETSTSVDPAIDPIETESEMKPEIQPIDTQGEELVKEVEGITSGSRIIDVDTIPEPRKLPKQKKDSSLGSAKDV